VIDRDGVGNWARHRSSATGTVVLGFDSMELLQGESTAVIMTI
jgi:hypothetical protein